MEPAVDFLVDEATKRTHLSTISRSIYDIKFRLSDSRIYNKQVEEIKTALAVNDNSDESTMRLRFPEKNTRTHNWSNSISLKSGVKTTLQNKAIPLIVEGNVELSPHFSTTYQWGETSSVEHIREVTYNVVVPPLNMINVTLKATRASYEVPFSYTQRDLLYTGQIVTEVMDDGLFTGSNAYNFDYQST